ncbi:MAG: GntR family transcriptional regulator [Microbacteriaceae bacterium]|nr:GntR family transcriptional regulator [Microbacteriaceae bacterium]
MTSTPTVRRRNPVRSTRAVVSRDSATALYQQIADALAAQIRARELAPFARLPSEAELMARFGVSRVTVRLALRRLADAGLVISRQGKGVFVSGPVVQQELASLQGFYDGLLAQGHQPHSTVLAFEHRSTVPVAGGRRLAEDTYRFRRLYRIGDLGIAVADATFTGVAGRSVTREDVERFPLYPLLKQVLGLEIARAHVRMLAARPAPDIAALLGTDPSLPVLQMTRTSVDSADRTLETTTFHIQPEVFAFEFDVSGPLSVVSAIRRTGG